jgi:hypothetical protein
VVDADVVTVFLSGTNNRGLVQELGRTKPRTTKKLLGIATNFASGEEAANAIIHPNPGSEEEVDAQGSTPGKKNNRRSRNKRRNRAPNDDDDDARMLAAADRSASKRPAMDRNNRFEQLLEKPCPHHEGKVKHKLKDCKLMKHFLAGGASSSGQRGGPKPPPNQDKGYEFPKADACVMIFGGPTA